jgi:tetraacyldisaccharide 4'-kinase
MSSSYHTYWRELASGKREEPLDRFVLLCMAPLAWLYSCVLRLRAQLYQWGMLKTHRLSRPVVSIGNITVGGTGKTPITAYCARYLLAQGHKVAVLSRGFGGSLEGQTCIVSDGATIMMSARECGDEPYLLASTVPGLMVVIGTDRYLAGLLAIQQLSPDIFLLDDGFQHLRLYRDLNILLLDCVHPRGNGSTLPAGLLREPWPAISRADFIIHTRCPNDAEKPAEIFNKPACMSRHTLHNAVKLEDRSFFSLSELQYCSVLAFAGIADPESFF